MINILITGDFCAWGRVEKLVAEKKYEEIFSDFTSIIQKADYSITDFEAPVVNGKAIPIQKSGPHLRTETNALEAVKKAGFRLLTLANNHFYDYGDKGVKDTLMSCQAFELEAVGGGKNLRQAQEVFYKEIKGKRFGFVNVCENEFSIATDFHGGSNPLHPVNNYYQIKEAKQHADYVIVITHGGHEMYPLPSLRMKETYRFFVDIGADVVVNHHQHCFSGYEVYKGVPIFYGLGNFSFDWEGKRNSIWNEGYGVMFSFENNEVSFSLHPYIQGNEKPGVTLMNENETDTFHQKIKELNHIIGDNDLLEQAFNTMISARKKEFLTSIEPYENKYLRFLFRKGLIPSFFSKKKKRRLLNTIRCESHRDVLLKVLSHENSHTL